MGHRNIAYLGGTEETDLRQDRIAGYRHALKNLGLGSPVVWNSEDSKMAGLNAFVALHENHPEITAVVCNGDMVALGACLALIRSGSPPGKDVSVIGFDDIQDAAVATPALTTMAVSPYQLGRRLARVILDRIRKPEMPQTVIEVSAQLTVRETTGRTS